MRLKLELGILIILTKGRMKRKRIIFILLALILLASLVVVKLNPFYVFISSEERFVSAWNENDSSYVKQYISSLKDKNVEEIGGICFVVLAEKTNFCYGILYFPKTEKRIFWDTIPEPKRQVIKYNIVSVWNLYSESKLFMKKDCKGVVFENGEEKTFHELYYPGRSEKFTSAELNQIKLKMDEVAMHCDESEL